MPESTEVAVRRMPFDLMRRGRVLDWLLDGTSPMDWFAPVETVPVDISRKNGELIVRASIPGFAPSEIDLQVDQRAMMLRAEHTEEHEEKDEHFFRRERRSGYCSRTIALPEEIVKDQVSATFKDGVLTVTAPVAQASAKKVEIKAGAAAG